MKCPECGEKMEQDTLREVGSVANPGTVDGKLCGKHHNGSLGVGVSIFRCDNCDSEWTRRGATGLRQLDGGAVPVDSVVRRENYN